MAKFVEERDDEIHLNEGEELGTFEPQVQIQEEIQQEPVEPQQPVQDEIPDKYRNKDIKDIIRMHQEAEKLLGKQSQEVGELRRTVDDFIKTQLNKQSDDSPLRSPVSDDDFYVSPTEAVQKTIESHPAIKEARLAAANLKKQEALAMLKNLHPDYEAVLADQGFVEWVQASNVRKKLLIQADRDFDVESADELLSLWKDKQQVVKATVEANRQANKNAVRQASVGSVTSSAEPKSRKIYRRADIVNLMTKDPARYEALQDEIMKAYSEGRVR